jgi:hypothetical protein
MVVRLAVVLVLATSFAIAHAAPPATTEVSPAKYVDGYATQVFAADGLAVALVLVSSQQRFNAETGPTYLYAAAAAFALGGPVLHTLHGRTETAFGSLALRVALPALGGFMMYPLVSGSSDCEECVAFIGFGIALGAATASILDMKYLAAADERPPATPAKPARPARPSWHTLVAPTRGGGTLGFMRAF